MLKLFIYTLVGSLLMLVGAIATGVLAEAGPDGSISFVLSDLEQRAPRDRLAALDLPRLRRGVPDQDAVVPVPRLDAGRLHADADPGARVFSAILSKVAAYGFIAIALPLFPQGAHEYQELLLLIALASILYGSAMAFTASQARLVLGYSSLAQLGFITLGIFALNDRGVDGALLQSVNHALVTVA